MIARADSFERFLDTVDERPEQRPTVEQIEFEDWLDVQPEGQAWWFDSVEADGERWNENETL